MLKWRTSPAFAISRSTWVGTDKSFCCFYLFFIYLLIFVLLPVNTFNKLFVPFVFSLLSTQAASLSLVESFYVVEQNHGMERQKGEYLELSAFTVLQRVLQHWFFATKCLKVNYQCFTTVNTRETSMKPAYFQCEREGSIHIPSCNRYAHIYTHTLFWKQYCSLTCPKNQFSQCCHPSFNYKYWMVRLHINVVETHFKI